MDWFPIVFFTFKLLALGIGMYFAIKWHYDQAKKPERGAVLRAGGKIAGAFILTVLVVGLLAFATSSMLGLDLGLR
jgi:predicted exporter